MKKRACSIAGLFLFIPETFPQLLQSLFCLRIGKGIIEELVQKALGFCHFPALVIDQFIAEADMANEVIRRRFVQFPGNGPVFRQSDLQDLR